MMEEKKEEPMKFRLLGLSLFFPSLLFAETVIASVNGTPVTDAEFHHWLKRCFRINYRVKAMQDTPIKRHLLKMYCYEKAILQRLAREGIFVKEEEVEKELKKLEEQYERRVGGEHPFARLLMERQITLNGLRWRIRFMLGVKKWAENQVREEVLRDYFEKHKNFFGGEMVRAKQITILTIDKETMEPFSPEQKRQALQRIQQIQREIRPDGSNFSELAKKYSESPSAKEGGDMGYFPQKGKVPKALAEAAFRLKVGEISPVIETPLGYHILYVTHRIPPKPVSFSKIRDWVKREFIRDKSKPLWKR